MNQSRYLLPVLLILLVISLTRAAEVEVPTLDRIVTASFDGTPIRIAAEDLVRDTGIKVRIDAGVDAPVTLTLAEVPLRTVLYVMIRSTGLTGRIEDGTFIISATPKDLLPRKPLFPDAPMAKDAHTVRVGLTSTIGGPHSITISCSGSYRVDDVRAPDGRPDITGGEQITLTAKDGSIEVRQLSHPDKVCAGHIRLETAGPLTAFEVVAPRVKAARYSGVLEISVRGSTLRIVNELPLDDYVRGVIPTEIPASFHPEAQKALVVAARTYAIRSVDRHKADGFNMCDSIHCQGFAGASRDAKWVNDLVDATRGEIMTYKGEPIFACYSADCGGMTQSSEDAGMMKTAYLRSVVDNPCGEPCLVVKKQVAVNGEQSTANGQQSGGSEQSAVNSEQSEGSDPSDESDQPEACPAPAMTEFEKPPTGDYCGSSRAHTWTKTYSAADLERVFARSSSTKVGKLISMEFAEYDCSGRVKTIIINGEDGEKRLTGSRFRDLFGLSTIMSTRMALTVTPDGKYVIEGRGYGHGVGLCQWGANGLAKSRDGITYVDILKHYYTSVEITKTGEQ